MKKIILMGLVMCLIVPFAYAAQSITPGQEFVIDNDYSSMNALKIYAVGHASVTAASFGITTTSMTMTMTTELGVETTKFMLTDGDRNTLDEIVSWGNSYTFKGISIYYVAAGTESAAKVYVWVDSMSLVTTGGLYPGTTTYVFGTKTIAQLEACIERDDVSTKPGLQGIWVVSCTGTGTATSLAVSHALVSCFGITRGCHFPLAAYKAALGSWHFELTNNASGIEPFVNIETIATPGSCLLVANEKTLKVDVRRYLDLEIPGAPSASQSTHIINANIYGVFTSTAVVYLTNDSYALYPRSALTTNVIYPYPFANVEFVGNPNEVVYIRAEVGTDASFTNGRIRAYGFYR